MTTSTHQKSLESIAEYVLNSREVGVVSKKRELELAQEECYDELGYCNSDDVAQVMEIVESTWSQRRKEARIFNQK